jgi:hypothetical protein
MLWDIPYFKNRNVIPENSVFKIMHQDLHTGLKYKRDNNAS